MNNFLNEYFIAFGDPFTTYEVNLFNIVFFSRESFPKMVRRYYLTPGFLKKKKEPSMYCKNYRSITLLSCLSKIFTSLLNDRLGNWSKAYNIITDAQFGSKAGYSTTDEIFILHWLISRSIAERNKLF